MANSRFKGLQPDDLSGRADFVIKNALDEVSEKLDKQFTTEIESEIWPWPRTTIRKVGPPVDSPRNIVDTADLKNSQTREQTTRDSVTWTWNVDYSALVHDGANRLKGGGSYPGRKWTKTAEERIKLSRIFADILRRELNG